MRKQIWMFLTCAAIALPSGAYAQGPEEGTSHEAAIPQKWEVTPVVANRKGVARVSCEIIGWDPPTYFEMVELRQGVEAKHLLNWYYEKYPVAEREPEIERFLRAYGLAIGKGDFEGFREQFALRELSEHSDPFISAMAWCLLDREEIREIGFLEWALELADRAELADPYGHPFRMIGLWLSGDETLAYFEHEREAEVIERGEQALVRACSLPNLGPVDREYLWRKYIEDRADSNDPGVRRAWLDRLEDAEGVDPWILHMSRGAALVNLAWDYRGDRFAGETTQEQFDLFGQTLREAREHVLQAWQFDPRLPEPATEMIRITMGGEGLPGQREHHWLARALAAQRDDSRATNAYRFAMRPRWGGSYAALMDLALSCVQPHFADTQLPLHARNIMRLIQTDTVDRGDPEFIYNNPEFAETYVRVLEFALEQTEPASELQFPGFQTRIAILKTRLGHLEEAAAILREVGDDYLPGAIVGLYEDTLNPHAETLPLIGATADLALAALQNERAGMLELARTQWQEAQAVVVERDPEDTLLLTALQDRIEVLSMRVAASQGEWVRVPLRADQAGLRVSANLQLTPNASGSTLVKAVYPTNQFFVWAPIDFGVYHEVEVSVRPGPDMPSSFRFSATFNSGITDSDNLNFVLFHSMLHFEDGLAGVNRLWDMPSRGVAEIQPDEDGWYRIRVVYDYGVISSSVNQAELPEKIRSRLGGPNPVGPKIGFAFLNHGNQAFEIKDLRARIMPKVFEDTQID